MKQNQYIVTLEIGSSKIVGMLAEKLPTGQSTITNVFVEQTSNCVRYGIVQNIENLKSSINRILKQIENAVDGTITLVFVGLSGRWLHNHTVEITRSIDSSVAISQESINGILAEARRMTIKGYEVIDAVPMSFVVDGAETRTPVGQVGSLIKANINLIIAKGRLKLNMERALSFGTNAKQYIITPVAMGEHLLSKDEHELGGLLLDIGAETTTMAYYRNNTLQYLNTLPMGGRNLTRDIANGIGIVEDTAEAIKRQLPNVFASQRADDVTIEGVRLNETSNYVVSRTDEILFNVDEALNAANLSTGAIKSVVLAGGTSLMPGLDQRVEQALKAKVRSAAMPSGLTVRTHTFNRLEYVESFALVMEASRLLGDRTCVERNIFETPEVEIAKPVEEKQPVEEVGDDLPKKPVKRSFLDRFKEALGNIFTEDDGDLK